MSGEEEGKYRRIMESRSDPSTYYGYLGMKLEELGEGTSVFTMEAGPRLHNAGGVVHGGAVASLADAAVAAALSTLVDLDEERIYTVEMKINYMAPVKEGKIRALGRIIQRGRSVAVGETEVVNGEGKMLAKAMATYLIKPRHG